VTIVNGQYPDRVRAALDEKKVIGTKINSAEKSKET
jgi:aspartokinase-like uncharacterized kinase